MLDIKYVVENKEKVKENIKKKFQDHKLPLVDEVIEIYNEVKINKLKRDELGSKRNTISASIGMLMKDKKIDEANQKKEEVKNINEELKELDEKLDDLNKQLKDRMMVIPNIIDDSVPIGEDDSKNVEIEKYGDPIVPEYEIPYHADIITKLSGLD